MVFHCPLDAQGRFVQLESNNGIVRVVGSQLLSAEDERTIEEYAFAYLTFKGEQFVRVNFMEKDVRLDLERPDRFDTL